MATTENGSDFTAVHHALLYVWLSRAAVQQCGEQDGETLMRRAVRIYGKQRGHRMALRARQNRHELTMANYLAYGEWSVPKGEMEQKIHEKSPHVRACIHRCPWHETWKKHNLISYGRSYCQEVDEALVNGFNPELKLSINSVQTLGDPCCEFLFHNAELNGWRLLGFLHKKAIKPGKTAVMGWDYHCAHLFKTIGNLLREELGQTGDAIIEVALRDFARYYGPDLVDRLWAASDADFESLPTS